MRFRRLFFLSLAEGIAVVASGIALAVLAPDVRALVFSVLIAQVVRTCGSYIVAPWRARLTFDWDHLKSLLTFGRWVTASNIVIFIAMQADDVFVGRVLGPAALGIYQVAYRFAQLPAEQITHVVSSVVFPALSSVSDDRGAFRQSYLRTYAVVGALTLAFTLFLLAVSGPGVPLALGEQWTAAVPVFRVLLIGGFLRSTVAFAGSVFYAANTPRLNFTLNLWRAVVLLVALYPLSAVGQVTGVAVASVLSVVAILPIYFRKVNRLIGLGFQDHARAVGKAMALPISIIARSWARLQSNRTDAG